MVIFLMLRRWHRALQRSPSRPPGAAGDGTAYIGIDGRKGESEAQLARQRRKKVRRRQRKVNRTLGVKGAIKENGQRRTIVVFSDHTLAGVDNSRSVGFLCWLRG